jgi:LmbE family N-acetylglucosaminyl deacetylase
MSIDFSDKMAGETDKQLQILVIMAHPADTFDHCGGTMAHHIERGDKVTVVGMYQGVHIHDEVIADQMRLSGATLTDEESEKLRDTREDVKNKEVIEACGILGITDVRFMGIEDKINLINEPTIVEIAKIIREIKPDILITHYPVIMQGFDAHGQAGEMVLRAAGYAGNLDFSDPNPGHRTPQILYSNPDNYLAKGSVLHSESNCYCDLFIDVSDVADKITKARNAMVSQQYNGNYARKSVEGNMGKMGDAMGTGYAEAFVRHKPELRYYLPLPKRLEAWANESEKEQLERRGYMIAPYVDLD